MNTFSIAGIFKGGAIGGIVAGIVNVGVYVVGTSLGAKYLVVASATATPEQVTAPRPFIMSVLFALVGASVLVGLVKLTPARAWTIFLVISGLFFASMIPGPFMVVPNDIPASVAFEVMHIVGAICVIGGISKFGRI